jgi:riboflavin kinase / FMN adenylyltransferase
VDASHGGPSARRGDRRSVFVGLVEHGDERGRILGFPTANLPLRRAPGTPPEGVYAAVAVTADGRMHRAAVSLGRRPTFYEDGFELLEAYLLDFAGDLYGQRLEVRLVERIRGQERFADVDALVQQMTDDVARTRELVGDDDLHAG